MAGRRRARGGLENEVFAVLAAAKGPLTPAAVQAALGGELAYTTVMTILARLHEKGMVVRERAGRAYAYAPAADRSTATAREMRRLLDRVDDRAAVLARFLDELGADDVPVLQQLLAETEPDDEPAVPDRPDEGGGDARRTGGGG